MGPHIFTDELIARGQGGYYEALEDSRGVANPLPGTPYVWFGPFYSFDEDTEFRIQKAAVERNSCRNGGMSVEEQRWWDSWVFLDGPEIGTS